MEQGFLRNVFGIYNGDFLDKLLMPCSEKRERQLFRILDRLIKKM